MALIPPPAFEFKHLPWTERSTAWEFWSRSLHNFVVAAGVISVKQKHGLLLYLGGMDLQDVYETLAPQSIHIEQGDVIDEYEAAMTMLTEHFNPTRAAGNPRQRGKENREIPRDKTSPVHPQETEAEIMSDSDELKSYTKNNEPEEANISESENREPEPDISDSENNPESEISESENDPESEISESENDPESEISDSENDPESEISDSENNPESEISESENDPESDISDSENDPESEISDSENKPRESGSKQRQPDKPVEIHTSFAIIQTEESERQVFDDDNDENRVEFRNSNCQRRRLNDHVEIHAPITPSPAMTQSEKSLKSDPQDNGRLSDETVNVSINEHVDSNELNSNSCLDVIATRNHYRKVYTDIKRDTWIPLPKSVTNMWWTKLWSCNDTKTIVTNSFPDSIPDRVPRDADAVPTPSAARWSSRHTRPPDSIPDRVPRDADAVPTPSAARWSSRHTRPPPRPPERLQCDMENFFPLDVRLSLGRNR